MPQLLLEFFSEEIPARMQARAEADLARLLVERLTAAGLKPVGLETFSTPRRLTVAAELPARSPDVKEERKGPRVGAPEKAIEGFVRGAGLRSIADARVVEDPKGAFYVADIERKGVETGAVIAAATPDIVRNFPWPKSMRSGSADLYWVRPLHSVLAAFNGKAVAIELPGVACGVSTEGHRFMAPGRFDALGLDDYRDGLKKRFVMLSRVDRKAKILADAKAACAARGLELVEDAGLLEEVTGLAEWPVVVVGAMDKAFLDLPGEVIRLTMRTHQRYFAVRDPKSNQLAPHFVTVANVAARDGGAEIARGNAKVLSARLNDARFFWDLDRKKGLEDPERLAKLDQIVFHQKLGTIGDKVRRIEALAVELAPAVGADVDRVRRAAQLCKADLVTETVGEFPELQGQIGRQLHDAAGGDPSVGVAIEDHYRPAGPNDRVPRDPVAICVALADKLDSLVGFWAIEEKPTGSSDAYGLRRAALGVVRLLLSNGVRMSLFQGPHWPGAVSRTALAIAGQRTRDLVDPVRGALPELARRAGVVEAMVEQVHAEELVHSVLESVADLPDFIAERLKVQLREQGVRHDLVDAVFSLGDDDLVRVVARVEALAAFLGGEDGRNLLAGYRRAANILAAEEKKGALAGIRLEAPVDATLLKEPAERALAGALVEAAPAARAAVDREDFGAAMAALAKLRTPVDAFFEAVLVNADDPALRANRLKLLHAIRQSLLAVADFSRIEG